MASQKSKALRHIPATRDRKCLLRLLSKKLTCYRQLLQFAYFTRPVKSVLWRLRLHCHPCKNQRSIATAAQCRICHMPRIRSHPSSCHSDQCQNLERSNLAPLALDSSRHTNTSQRRPKYIHPNSFWVG